MGVPCNCETQFNCATTMASRPRQIGNVRVVQIRVCSNSDTNHSLDSHFNCPATCTVATPPNNCLFLHNFVFGGHIGHFSEICGISHSQTKKKKITIPIGMLVILDSLKIYIVLWVPQQHRAHRFKVVVGKRIKDGTNSPECVSCYRWKWD